MPTALAGEDENTTPGDIRKGSNVIHRKDTKECEGVCRREHKNRSSSPCRHAHRNIQRADKRRNWIEFFSCRHSVRPTELFMGVLSQTDTYPGPSRQLTLAGPASGGSCAGACAGHAAAECGGNPQCLLHTAGCTGGWSAGPRNEPNGSLEGSQTTEAHHLFKIGHAVCIMTSK